MSLRLLIVTALVYLPLPLAVQADFSGHVVGVADGDTLTVVQGEAERRVRLNGIDAPEHRQAYGDRSKAFAADLALGKTVTIREHGQDKYGRTIGDVMLPDGRSLNQELLRAGLAWWYHQHSSDQALGHLEIEARAAKRGLWTDTDAMPPWAFRHQGRLNAAPRSSPHDATSVAPPFSAHQPIIGNRKSRIYQRPDCSAYDDVRKQNRVPFTSTQHPAAAGYRPAQNCSP